MSELSSFNLCEKAISLTKDTREKAIELCILLDEIYETEAYKNSHHGGEDNFIQELGMSAGAVSKYTSIGRAIRVFGLDKKNIIDVKNIESAYLASRSQTKEEAESLIEQAKVLTFKDLKKIVGKVDECKHQWETLTMRKCNNCNTLEVVDKPFEI